MKKTIIVVTVIVLGLASFPFWDNVAKHYMMYRMRHSREYFSKMIDKPPEGLHGEREERKEIRIDSVYAFENWLPQLLFGRVSGHTLQCSILSRQLETDLLCDPG